MYKESLGSYCCLGFLLYNMLNDIIIVNNINIWRDYSMTKYHINKHGVPAPCKAKEGNCPLGGNDTHFDNLEDAETYAHNKNEQEFSILPGEETSGVNIKEEGKYLTGLINRRSKAVEPNIPEGSLDVVDDLDTGAEIYDEFITRHENDPVNEAREMFDHLSHKKLRRYESEGEYPLSDFSSKQSKGAVNWDQRMSRHEAFLESEGYFDEDYSFGEEGRQKFKKSAAKRGELMRYAEDLTLEYAKDFEKKVKLTYPKYSLEEEDLLAEEYKDNLEKKIGKFMA